MSFTLKWSPPDRVDATYHGAVTASELATSLAEIVGDLRFDPLRHVVCDFRNARSCNPQTGDLETIGAVLYGAYVTNPRVVVIVISTDPGARDKLRRFTSLELLRYPLHAVADAAAADELIRNHG